MAAVHKARSGAARTRAELEAALRRLAAERDEALAQQTATAEVLGVINASSGDLAPVFGAIVDKALSLCGAALGGLGIYDGETWRAVTLRGYDLSVADLLRRGYRPIDDPLVRPLVDGAPIVHIADLSVVDHPVARAAAQSGMRTLLLMPLRKEGRLLGTISAVRLAVDPFSAKEIALLRSFAAQAVIAMDNARLLTETRERSAELQEALDYQTATSEFLKRVSHSNFELPLVLDALVETAARLSGAEMAILHRRDDGVYRMGAAFGVPSNLAAIIANRPVVPGRSIVTTRALAERHVVQIVDVTADPDYTLPEAAALADVRTVLGVPLLREGEPVGAISLARRRVEPFSERQIALLEDFAAQAVIAIENSRLLTETQEAMTRQGAIDDVIQTMSRSVFDLDGLLRTVINTAAQLCRANYAVIYRYQDGAYRFALGQGLVGDYERYERETPIYPGAGSLIGRVALERKPVRISDAAVDPDYQTTVAVDVGRARSMLGVPLLRDGEPIGAIGLSRGTVNPFTDKELALVTTFADQAVIAIENARLVGETREALEQQTATAEVLQIINASPGNLDPVFDAILEKAMRLCDVEQGHAYAWDGGVFRPIVARGDASFVEWFWRRGTVPLASTGQGPAPRIARGEDVVHIPNVREDAGYAVSPGWQAQVEAQGGNHSLLSVALRKDDRLLGILTIYRAEVRPFTAKQIAVVQHFAAQAVIAMENARLLTETRDALEQQTATAEVLQVINASPGNLDPVFEALMDRATRLCEAPYGHLWTYDGERFRAAATHGAAEFSQWVRARGPIPPRPGAPVGRIVAGESYVQLLDALADGAYPNAPEFVEQLALRNIRTLLAVPLRREGMLRGVFILFRQEVKAFSEAQIALLQNFADQAVIAMENARLITETREALEQQTATAEVLGVINTSPGDLAPVFKAMLEKGVRLCEAHTGHLFRFENDAFFRLASHGVAEDFDQLFPLDRPVPLNPNSIPARMIATRSIVHVSDQREDASYRLRLDRDVVAAVEAGILTVLFVPLIKEGEVVGHFTMHRTEVRPFSDKQISLLQNFAAQAVIAIENARLITETREALEQQTATAEVLRVINSSPGDLRPVFETILDKAHALCGAERGTLFVYDGEKMKAAVAHGYPADVVEHLRAGIEVPPHHAPLFSGNHVHIHDLTKDNNATGRVVSGRGGVRTNLLVPLFRNGALIGMISCNRTEVRPFSDKEIALIENFAQQAVIGIENARLLSETREALEQQTATAEVLGVINSSPGDLAPVFAAMVERAASLCEADEAAVRTFDGELLHLAATHGTDAVALEQLRELGPAVLRGLYAPFARGDDIVHYADARDTDAYRSTLVGKSRIDARGIRTWLAVALRKDAALLGIINVHRHEVRPFSDKQIALLQNFAAQAVVAIENARLLHEIRQRQAELRVTFDNMGDGVVMFDRDLRLAAWNKNFQELLDLPDDILEQRKTYTEYLHLLAARGEFGSGDVEEELNRRLAHAADELRFERTRPDGRILEVRRNAVAGGGFVLIYSDITERKRAETEISAARDSAEAALRDLQAAQSRLIQAEKMASLGQLTAGIAHEIKNPLNFVNNFASLSNELLAELKDVAEPAIKALDGDKREELDETMALLSGNLEKIAEHGRRADNIVKSMLEHSRGISGERRAVDLNALVEESLNLAYHGARAQDQTFNITLERAFEADLRPVELVPQDMTRVFLNLIGNGFYAARKRARASENGFRPVLHVTTVEHGDTVEVRIRDNGTGIPPDIRDKLFQPFFTTKPTGEGTGLGLSISYDIVTQEHGGTIAVDSRENEFTEFTIRLPRQAPQGPASR